MEITRYFQENLFEGKTVFLTGGGSGINLGIAKCFASLGARLAICGRSLERLEKAAGELEALGAEVHYGSADVRDYDAMEAVLASTQEALGAIDVLVCGAAGNFLCKAEKLSPNGFKTVLDIDLLL